MIFSVLTYSLFESAAYAAREPWHLMARYVSSPRWGWEASGPWELRGCAVLARDFLTRLGRDHRCGRQCRFSDDLNVGLHLPCLARFMRRIMLAGTSPAVLVFFIALFVPESERWKAAVRRAQGLSGTRIFRGASPTRRGSRSVCQQSRGREPGGPCNGYPIGSTRALPRMIRPPSPWRKPGSRWARLSAASSHPCWAVADGRRPVYFGMRLISLVACQYMFLTFDAFSTWFLTVVFFVGAVTASFYGWLPLYLPDSFPHEYARPVRA